MRPYHVLSCSLIGPEGNFGVGVVVKLYVAADFRRSDSMLLWIDPDFLAKKKNDPKNECNLLVIR